MAVNVTPGSRIADWSDAELTPATREKVRPDGSVIGPPMPIGLFRCLPDDDLMSMVMFLRTVPASAKETPFPTHEIPLPPPHGPSIDGLPAIPVAVTVEYGEYLACPVAHCV